jgi:hypothetical protein
MRVYALAIQMRGPSSPLLGVRLELRLERRELGERGVRIGLPIATPSALASLAALDVFGAQLGIAVGTIAALRAVATRWAVAALVALPLTVGSIRTVGARRTVSAIGTILPIGTVRLRGMVVPAMPAVLVRRLTAGGDCLGDCGRGAFAGRRRRDSVRRRGRLHRRLPGARLAAALRLWLRAAWTALAVGTPAGPPDLHRLGLFGLGLGCRRRLLRRC